MASFNGLQLKSYKRVGTGHEGDIYNGTLYLNGKKIGTTTSDSWGGPDIIDFDGRILKDIVKAYNGYANYSFDLDLDCLVGFLNELNNFEKAYKKYLKQGYKTFVTLSTDFSGTAYATTETDDEKILNSDFHKKLVKDLEKKQYGESDRVETKIFHDLSDFDIISK